MEAIMEKAHLPNVENLEFEDLSITELWHNEPSVGSFSKLKSLEVEGCKGMVKIIPGFMVKRLQNLEKLVVSGCNNLETVFELKWLVDQQEDSESKQPACFPYFQNLASIHVGDCEYLKNIFTISEQHPDQYGETTVSDIIVQLPQLACIRLVNLPNFSHLLLVMQGQFVLELSSLKEFFLFEAGDKEIVTRKVTFPEELEIKLSEMPNFFGSRSSVKSDIAKALQTNQVVIGLLGDIGGETFEQLVKDESHFDKLLRCYGEIPLIENRLQNEFGIVFGEAEAHGQAERVRKTLLSYISYKRLIVIIEGIRDEDILVATGIPVDAPPKQLKIILISKKKELLLKIGAQLTIPVGDNIEDSWKILLEELHDSRQEELTPAAFEDTDICSFIAPTTLLLNNITKTLCGHQNNDQIIIGILLRSTSDDYDILLEQVGGILEGENLIDKVVEQHDNEVDTIQKMLKKALGISTSSCERADDGFPHENEAAAECSSSNQPVDKKRLLLVLKNLDEEVDLEAVGIPQLHHDVRLKIILVSKNRQVLQNMGAQRVFEFEGGESSNSRLLRILDGYVELEELVKLADECGNSEDLLKLLAKKLNTQGMHAWANAFRQLKESPFEYHERRKVIASL